MIGGDVVDQQTGLAVSGATVILYQGATRVASTVSDANGRFAFPPEPAGLYDIEIAAVGYQPSRLADEAIVTGAGAVNDFNGVYGERFGLPERSIMLTLTSRTR